MHFISAGFVLSWHNRLTHWCRVTHICVGKLTTIGSDNGLSPGRRQAIIWPNAGILLIESLGTNFSEILNTYNFIQENAFENGVWKRAAILSRPQCVKRCSLNTSSRRLSLSKAAPPASHPSVTRLFQCGAIESPVSRRKMQVLREALLVCGDRPLLYDKLAISNTYSYANNRNDLRPITLSKVSLPEVGFPAVAI